jgi:hypothetical protein
VPGGEEQTMAIFSFNLKLFSKKNNSEIFFLSIVNDVSAA